MEYYKSGKGRVLSQNNYTERPQFQNRNCYSCGKFGHFVRDCPTKRRNNNGAQFEPHNQQRYYWDQRPVTEIWRDGSIVSNFEPQNKCCHEIARKISASNLHEGFSSRLADFCEDYSSSDSSEDYSSSNSASDSSEDYSSDSPEDCSSNFSDSMEDCSFAAYGNQFEDYFSSAPETSSAVHLSGVSSSSVSYSSSSASNLYTDKCEGQDINEFKDWEEIHPRQCATSSIAERESDGNQQVPIYSGVDSPSQITRKGFKESLGSAECHNAVQSMHNLSVLLLINSSFSDNLSESDLQTLQSVICNVSQCLLKRRGVSNSTHLSAFKPGKQLVAANSEKTGKDTFVAERKEDPARTRSSQMSAKVFQSQMANIEVELNLIESEFRKLRAELERKGVKKTHAGTHKKGHIETLANREDVNNGSCTAVNLFMMENDFDYTSSPFSEERSGWLPDLNLDPITEDEMFTGGCYIKINEENVISQNNIREEPIQSTSLSTSDHDPGKPNAEAETKQNEEHFRVLKETRSCSDYDIAYIRDYIGNNLLEDG